MPFERGPQFFQPETGQAKEDAELERNINESKREIFEEAGEHSPEILFEKMKDLEGVLENEKGKGESKLKDTIDEIRESPEGDESFIDGAVAYLPPKGEAIFVGDIHGDAEAVASIVEQTRFIEKMEKGERDDVLVFLGDYADRGKNDVAVVEEVINLKLHYPENVILIRGNHEETEIGTHYGFYQSLTEKYGEEKGKELFEKYNETVEKMPGIVVTGNGIVGVHGGIPSREINSLKDLNDEKILYQMRWNDPTEETAERKASGRGDPAFQIFGQRAFERFMGKVGGKLMVRSHEYPFEGYNQMFDEKLITIFSNGSEKSPSSGYKKEVKNAIFMKARLEQEKFKPDFLKVLYKKPEIIKPPKMERSLSITEAQNFTELFTALRQIEGLQGTQEFYSSLELRKLINKVREGKLDISHITRTGGLREKVKELLKGRST